MPLDRRSWLAAQLAWGMTTMIDSPATSAEKVAARLPNKDEIPTPALLVDLDRLDANLARMAAACRDAGCRLRPHAKTHKCPPLARRQLDSGAVGICCATVGELDALARAGITGLLLTSPVVEPVKLRRIVELARAGHALTLAIGHSRQVELLAQLAGSDPLSLDVLIDLDVGDRRTGIVPGEGAVELARLVARLPGCTVRGVQAYAGHASHVRGFEPRREASHAALQKAVETREQLERAGFEASILSGGSTGTYNIDSRLPGFNELQAGSYVFMDVDYRIIGGADGNPIYTDFLPSLTVLTTVVSATHADRVTVDAGTKAIDTTTSHRPESVERPGYIYQRGGDEFGMLTLEPDARLPRLGERLEFIVPHCDPTINLHDRLYVVRGGRVVDVWPIVARRGLGE